MLLFLRFEELRIQWVRQPTGKVSKESSEQGTEEMGKDGIKENVEFALEKKRGYIMFS